jgi:hypothetical protein
MKHVVWSVLLLLAACPAALAQEHHAPEAARPAILFTNLGHLHHPIATKSVEAQKFFDQGLTLVYAFNHDEAIRSFQRAVELDPHSPMPWWGIALALGPNINMPMDEAQHRRAYDALQKAPVLVAPGALPRTTMRQLPLSPG